MFVRETAYVLRVELIFCPNEYKRRDLKFDKMVKLNALLGAKRILTKNERRTNAVFLVLNIVYLASSIYLVVEGIRKFDQSDRLLLGLHKLAIGFNNDEYITQTEKLLPDRMFNYNKLLHGSIIAIGKALYLDTNFLSH